ncbi:hypothetical protein JDV02_003115 [Purpureocillium takamizusanense]|uniref:Uncharacterized protein n=1 Tax=Purpureocillium takamizusanense TaxID=2060973 RepID=A0A9Q8V9H9_9HYPO|nr:uncharacterized protein JDV02_003115 [Purpureocillium takamizusanense]UNI16701.1 hypothetical protein JDV02_003115 [Purpureocillium takamizusanense]
MAADRSSSSPEFRLSCVSLPVLSSPDSLTHSDATAQAAQSCSPPCAPLDVSHRMSQRKSPEASGLTSQQSSPSAGDRQSRGHAKGPARHGDQRPDRSPTSRRHSPKPFTTPRAPYTTDHCRSPSQPANGSTLAASPVRPRSEIPPTRPPSSHQGADRGHTIGRFSPKARAQSTSYRCSIMSRPTNGSTLALSPERPRSEIPPTRSPSAHSGVTKRSGYYERPDSLHRFKGHSPSALAQLQTRDTTDFRRSPPQPASGSSLPASSIRPRSEIHTTWSTSTSPRFAKRSQSRQQDDGLQENTPGTSTQSESVGDSICWSWSQPASRSTPLQSPSGRWERRPSVYPRKVPEYLRGLPSREAYGQLSGTQGFEDSEDDFVSVDLND